MALHPGEKVGPFVILGLISKAGGFADIYEAAWEEKKTSVALKVLRDNPDPFAAGLFRTEARVLEELAPLNHPAIVGWLASGNDGPCRFIAMEKLEQDVFSTLKIKPMPPTEATRLILQVCDALIAVHDRGFVHHDLHTHNLLWDGRGNVKLTDFGIAYVPGEEKPPRKLGIDQYMSPEEVRGVRDDPRSDLYCLGLTYLHLLTSRRFPRHRDEPIPEPNEYGRTTGITPDCVAVLMRLLEKDPARRFQTARDALAALKRIDFSSSCSVSPEMAGPGDQA